MAVDVRIVHRRTCAGCVTVRVCVCVCLYDIDCVYFFARTSLLDMGCYSVQVASAASLLVPLTSSQSGSAQHEAEMFSSHISLCMCLCLLQDSAPELEDGDFVQSHGVLFR